MITNRVLGSILLGATQQISCSSCGGGFASIGSFALGGSGRWSLSDTTTLIGGISYNQWSASGITVNNAPTVAGALVYDFVKWGSSRPFLEVGAGLTPYEQVNYTRTYPNGASNGYWVRLCDEPRRLSIRACRLGRSPHSDRRSGRLRGPWP